MINNTNSTSEEVSVLSTSTFDEPPFDCDAIGNNHSTTEEVSQLSKLREVAAKNANYDFIARLSDERHEVKVSKKGNECDWVSLEVKITSSKEEKSFTRSKPLFTEEGQMLVHNAPYDPDAYYRVSVHKPLGGFSTWTNIEKVDF